MKPSIAIVDYGVGNLGSLRRAVGLFSNNVFVTEEPEKIEKADAVILPGVGAFAAGMEGLRVRGLVGTIKDAAARGVPILGICLGAQLLLERGYEFGEYEGLGIVKGEVVRFPEMPAGVTIPAIGWQEVVPGAQGKTKTLFAGLERPFMYFVHSYVLAPKDPASVLAETSYGDYTYCAVVGEGSVVGTQFHPEKSGQAGLKLLSNFIDSIKL